MGGHNAGDVASKLAINSIGNYFEATANGAPIGDLAVRVRELPPGAPANLAAGVRKANADVSHHLQDGAALYGMGSTVVGLPRRRRHARTSPTSATAAATASAAAASSR